MGSQNQEKRCPITCETFKKKSDAETWQGKVKEKDKGIFSERNPKHDLE